MATGYRQKTLCSICQKASSAFTCRGCQKDFCYRHVAEHRQELNKQMEEIITNHDQLQQNIVEQEAQPNVHPLMKKIDEWEQESIEKIHQAAENTRQNIIPILNPYRIRVKNQLINLTTELNEARNEDDYVETELRQWTEQLDKLKIELNLPHLIDFNQDDNESSLIPKISINAASHDIFQQIKGNIQISEDGKVVTRGSGNGFAAARCKGVYSFGQHRFCFRIEDDMRRGPAGIFCGIMTKSTPMDSILIPTAIHNNYGHATIASESYSGLNQNVACSVLSFTDQLCAAGLYELLVDCDKKTMCLTGQQNSIKHEVWIDVNKYPLPWQFFVTIFYPGVRIRLC